MTIATLHVRRPVRHSGVRGGDVGRRHATAPRLLVRVSRTAANVLLALAAVGFLVLAVGPHVLGYRTATMLTGSMEPGIETGDVVVAFSEPAADVQVGDVISYHIPVEDHRVETHRVIEVRHSPDGEVAVRTQGDANNGVDPWLATLDGDSVWQVKAHVPYVGDLIRFLRAPLVHALLVYGAGTALVLLLVAGIWRRPVRGAHS